MVTLSAFQLGSAGVVGLLALLLVAGLCISVGEERATRKLCKQARENGVDPRWLGVVTDVGSEDE